MDFKLTHQQESAIDMVFNNKVSILTGGAGTGKTTTIKYIIKKAEELRLIIRQAAPTGRAAKRMMEASGKLATTIHTLLGCDFDSDGNFIFLSDEDNPIYADLIILDEVSMIDNSLMYHFLMAVNPVKTTILFTGDAGQLPSVGAGAILRDMISSKKIPHIELDVIHRNSGKIVEACSHVRRSQFFIPNTPNELDLNAENPINLVHVQFDTQERTLKAIGDLVDRMGVRGFDKNNDVQVISPVNKRGDLSCESVNNLLKEQLNPATYPEKEGDKFRIGDKVINTKNQSMEDINKKQCLVVNGDIGFVVDIQGKQATVKFSDPERIVKMPANSNKLLHAWCITCHRFQGSQAPVIIIPLDRSFSFFCNSKWLYTAISRATTLCVLVGDFNAVGGMVNNVKSNVERKTMLKENIIEWFDSSEENVFEEDIYCEFGDI